MPDLAELERIDAEWRGGDRAAARAAATAYAAAFASELAPLDGLSIPEIVQIVEGYRASGREHDRIAADAYLLANFPPQTIVGVGVAGQNIPLAELQTILANAERQARGLT